MPMIDVKGIAAQDVGDAVRAALAEELTVALLRHRGVPDAPPARRNVWLFFHPLPAWVGGRPPGERRVVVTFTVVAGGLDDAGRTGLVADGAAAVARALPGVASWVLIEEVPDGSWGADGAVTRLADAQAALGA